ncbi:MAG: P-loop containing nucleoside triphosphate hydrolase protein [Olpidium bornovanus]|uniref:RNA helicase n=1 Tax=Olpidium bornovanus TaxID=278681 RepID=A0A8H8DH28_9FUNG|nr:MAG: P-loop containing nucleoside triphosphate hydrolase protein [Olpidium bornovanus]
MSLFRGKAPPPPAGGKAPAAAAAASAASAVAPADGLGAPGGKDEQGGGGCGGDEAKGNEKVWRRKRKRAAGPETPAAGPAKAAAIDRSRGSAEEPLAALQRHRRSLPVFEARSALLHNINKHSTVVIVGETGSGKTTQIPQYIVEAGPAGPGGVVGVTQPRRVAAVNLAHRVAEEMRTTLGRKVSSLRKESVGYSVRFKSVFSPKHGVLKFLTDGMLLRELLVDPLLSSYSTIVLDEAHERSVRTDLLFGMVKSVQKQRKEMIKSGVRTYPVEEGDKAKGAGAGVRVRPLKIVVMSATLDCERFSEYFDGCVVA